ncbi:hypothetical protein SteCoe_25406 [Stentor coeruleus]|uniref:RING-type domain-containing protein n=1 Tax=Stentor coeruleus TaxID=5963 RepID=A0A1R2BFC2_9CILI|nr:hypothetical protein SteCoe_25406 [Stentor coeruleus]
MFWFLYLFNITTADYCSDSCIPCRVEQIVFIKNTCDNSICLSKDYCNNNCYTCLLDSGVKSQCDLITYTSRECTTSSVCGKKIYNSESDTLSIKNLAKSSLCFWYIDLTGSSDNHIDLEFEFSGLERGTLLIESYNLASGMSLSNAKSIENRVTGDDNKSSYSMRLENTNMLLLIYYSGNSNKNYSGLKIVWGDNSGGNSNILGKALTITALCLVSIFCMGCCGVLCRRLYKSARNTSRVYDQVVANYQRRSRNYEALPENSIISDADIQRFFPKQLFKEALLEVGEKVCCICFEEFNAELYVRKLPCKHVFHSKCIEDWFVGRMVNPKCPLCKNNPFNPEPEHPVPERASIIDVPK